MDSLANPLTPGDSPADFSRSDDPFALFSRWLSEAHTREINDPGAMALATVDSGGLPNVRMVLLKGFDQHGLVFYSNAESAKGRELLETGKAALLFHWKSLRLQVRFRGLIETAGDAESDAYFNSRPRYSRIGAWASQQSRPLESRFALEKSVAHFAAKYAVGTIPRPPYWYGFRLQPLHIEFWADGSFRLHDRIAFTRETLTGEWKKQRLYP